MGTWREAKIDKIFTSTDDTDKEQVYEVAVQYDDKPTQCSPCGGTGRVTRTRRNGTGDIKPRKCHACEGTGFVPAQVPVDKTVVHGNGVHIGVITSDTSHYHDGYMTLWGKHNLWCWKNKVHVLLKQSILRKDLHPFPPGSVVRIALDSRRVFFLLKVNGTWVEQFTFTLPEQCGNITLGVDIHRGSKVTLLP